MGFLSNLFRRKDTAKQDGQRLYFSLLAQSRQPIFYGDKRLPDSYDGRVDLITLHQSILMRRLRDHGEDGQRLSQALFDAMKDDFEIALREEGITDSGVKRRIKPMIEFFYARLRAYDEAIGADSPQSALIDIFAKTYPEDTRTTFWPALSDYALELNLALKDTSLGHIALSQFTYPEMPEKISGK